MARTSKIRPALMMSAACLAGLLSIAVVDVSAKPAPPTSKRDKKPAATTTTTTTGPSPTTTTIAALTDTVTVSAMATTTTTIVVAQSTIAPSSSPPSSSSTTTTPATTVPETTTPATTAPTATTTAPAFVGTEPGQMFISRAELNSKPTSGPGWDLLKSKADMASYGVVDLGDQGSATQSHVLAGALVYARTGDVKYRDKVVSYVRQTCGTEADGPHHLLGLARTLYGYVVAADLVGMPLATTCTNGQTWGDFLAGIRTKEIAGHSRWRTLEFTSADTSNNWGAYALSSHLAVSYALGDAAAVQRDLDIFRRFLGDTTSPAAPFSPSAGYRFGDNGSTWDMSPTLLRGINPRSDGDPRGGALIEDVLRYSSGGDDSVVCCSVQSAAITYQEETLDGILSTAQLFRANGVDTRALQDNALQRAYHFLVSNGGPGPYSLTRYLPYAINYLYGTNYPTQPEDRPYRHMGYGSWLFTGSSN
jgi:hypothetical protein